MLQLTNSLLLLTSQPEIVPLKILFPPNIPLNEVPFETSHLEMSGLQSKSQNKNLNSVTQETFQSMIFLREEKIGLSVLSIKKDEVKIT